MTVRALSWAGMILILVGGIVIGVLKAGRASLQWGCGGILVGIVLLLAALVVAAGEIKRQGAATHDMMSRALAKAEAELKRKKEEPRG